MNKPEINVRLKSIGFENIKNIKQAYLEFPVEKDVDRKGRNNIFGIYGPNGSGKTSLISCLNVLKKILCEMPLNKLDYNLINVDSQFASMSFEFDIKINSITYYAKYSFVLEKVVSTSNNGLECKSVTLKSETLKYKVKNNDAKNNASVSTLIEINLTDPINKEMLKPVDYYYRFMKDPSFFDFVVKTSVSSRATNRSFIFNHNFLGLLQFKQDFKKEYYEILSQIKLFGLVNLFVVDQVNNNNISLNLGYRFIEEKRTSISLGQISVGGLSILRENDYLHYDKSIKDANYVLSKLIPGINISTKKIKDTILNDGTKGVEFILVSNRADSKKEIPFSSESNGIRSIFSVLSLVIAAYNNPSVCIAIDEFDAGVFEHLLGVIVKTYSESGKGLFIFTSHNLRPLEVLNANNIIFTTKDSDLFKHTTYVRKELNKRNAYLRFLSIGNEDNQILSDKVKDYELRNALRSISINE